jgi:sucrose-phosphate synthase
LRITLISLHGLLRGHNWEIGRDADNGGQIVYVMQLARALSELPSVERVQLYTRLIDDPELDGSYAQPLEKVTEKFAIRRIPFGGKRYLLKEQLWPHLDEFVGNAVMQIHSDGVMPHWLHSHYADAGYAAARMSRVLEVPFLHTGHSLGRRKLEKLLASGMKEEDAMERYRFTQRFEAEEMTLARAAFVVCSSDQEKEAYRDYGGASQACYRVVPPGTDGERFFPYYEKRCGEQKQARASLEAELGRFLRTPDKPLILALSRADGKKNLQGLIEAYGTDPELQAIANLAVFAGNREDIGKLPAGQSEVFSEILHLQDKFNLYGKLAIPKTHDSQWETPELYRLAADTHGVFVNVAFTEPFGLTLLEAAASGLPVVATDQGGPVDIVRNLGNGILVSPRDVRGIQSSIRQILLSEKLWRKLSNSGIRNLRQNYSWESHVKLYLQEVEPILLAERLGRAA